MNSGESFKIENHFRPRYEVTNISPKEDHFASERPARLDDRGKPVEFQTRKIYIMPGYVVYFVSGGLSCARIDEMSAQTRF